MFDIVIILESVMGAIVSIMVMCFAGVLLFASKTVDQSYLNQLSRVIERVFVPSLIISSFLQTITIQSLWHILPIAVSAFLVCAVGYIVGLISSIFWIKDQQNKSIVIMACSNPHTVSIQLQITFSLKLLLEAQQKQQNYENKIDTTIRAITAIMIFSTVTNTLRWSLGNLLYKSMAKTSEEKKEEIKQLEVPMNNNTSINYISEIVISSKDLVEPQEIIQPIPSLENYGWRIKIKKFFGKIFQISMPLLAIALSIIIMIIYPLQRILVDNSSFLHQSIFAPLQILGKAQTPSVLILLGANMCSIIQRNNQGERNSIDKATLMKVTFTRLILVPIVGFGVLYLLVKSDFLKDPCVIFVTFLTYITPTAVNILVQAKQYSGNDDVVSQVIVYSYLGSILTLPIWVVLFFMVPFW